MESWLENQLGKIIQYCTCVHINLVIVTKDNLVSKFIVGEHLGCYDRKIEHVNLELKHKRLKANNGAYFIEIIRRFHRK